MEWAILGEAVLSLVLGAVILWRGLDRAVAVVLAAFFGVWSALLFIGTPFLDGDLPGWALRLYALLRAGLVSLTFALMAVYPPGRPARQKRLMLYLAFVPVLLAGIGAIANHYPPANESPSAFLYFLLTALNSPVAAYLPVTWFLVHTLKAPPGPRRMQYAGAAAALLIWTMNDGLEPIRRFQRMGLDTFEMDAYTQIYAVTSMAGMLATVGLVVLIVAKAMRDPASRAAAVTVGNGR